MSATHRVADRIVERGQKIYDQKLRSILEPEHNGKYIVIDVDTGEYEIDDDFLTASVEHTRISHIRSCLRRRLASGGLVASAVRDLFTRHD